MNRHLQTGSERGILDRNQDLVTIKNKKYHKHNIFKYIAHILEIWGLKSIDFPRKKRRWRQN